VRTALARLDAAQELLQSSNLRAVQIAFKHMGFAEEAIAEFSARHPHLRLAFNKAFFAIRWHKAAERVPDVLVVHHMNELLQRIVDGKKLDEGTQAEVLFGMHTKIQKVILDEQALAVFEQLFAAVMGENVLPPSAGVPFREPWPKAAAELLQAQRRRLRLDRYAEK
jgi:hypothetical protein